MTPHPPAGPGEGVSAHGAASLKRVSASVLTLIVILAVSLAGGCSTAKPGKIVSLSPSATEILFQIGAGDEVVGVDEHSTYPPEVRSRRDSKLSGLNPDLNQILSYRPSIVILSERAPASGMNSVGPALTAKGVKVLIEPAPEDVEGVYRQIQKIGAETGREEGAEKLASTMRKRIGEIVRRTTKAATVRSYYHELDNTYYSATSNTFIGSIYAMFGLRNIADKFDSEGSGYPKLSAKNVVAANPDIIFLADTNCCGQNAATVAARPGWEKISAVRDKRIVALNDDIASRWGPRLVDLVQVISQKIR
ncbi:ABC transporter substrate-binding protein [Streptosporangium sp. NPDC006007]|uniref:ABC transporter substrate-binding protein n=1 Tax=Streptosporangium sp. NPDC006007 TaxID=3154575 RepID=UPI0033B6F809